MGTVLMLIGLFLGSVIFILKLCCDPDGCIAFWPANAVLLVALLTLRKRQAAIVFVCCFVGYLLLASMTIRPFPRSILTDFLNIVQVLVAAPLTRWFCGATSNVLHLQRAISFAVIAAISAGIEAVIGGSLMQLFHMTLHFSFGVVAQWWICDSLGLFITTPVVLWLVRKSWRQDKTFHLTRQMIALMFLGLLVVVACIAYPDTALFLFIFPVFVLFAFQAEIFWVGLSIFVIAVLISSFTAHDMGPIVAWTHGNSMEQQALLQPYLIALIMVFLPINTAIRDRRRVERRVLAIRTLLEYQATHDALTGLLNRRAFYALLQKNASLKITSAIMLIDLDYFKSINDTHGHAAGDRLLCMVAQRLHDHNKPWGGVSARLGGDEFAVFFQGCMLAKNLNVIGKSLLMALRKPYDQAGTSRRVTVSIGAAFINPTEDPLARQALARADKALYVCKHRGRNGFEVIDRPFPLMPR